MHPETQQMPRRVNPGPNQSQALCCVLSHFSCVWLFSTPYTTVHQAPLVHGILKARILRRAAIPSSRGSSPPRNRTHAPRAYLQWQVGSSPLPPGSLSQGSVLPEVTLAVWAILLKKPKSTASSPITSWQTEGENVEAGTDFLFLGSKISADGDCSHETRRQLLFGRKAMTNLDGV